MRSKRTAYILFCVFLLGLAGYIIIPYLTGRKISEAANSAPSSNSTYVKEGEVIFWKSDGKVKKIDVEIAENDAARAKGLMFRSSIPDSVGMLFIFDEPEAQAFWMKNTSIPLDIIYVANDRKIISIAKNTKPYSEDSIPSYGKARYVVEVNAGFTERNNIKSGDAVSF